MISLIAWQLKSLLDDQPPGSSVIESEVRAGFSLGEGLFLAVRVVDPSYIPFIIAHAPDYGMVLDYFLFCNDAFRIAPPLIINDNQIADACSSLMRLLDAAENNFGKV